MDYKTPAQIIEDAKSNYYSSIPVTNNYHFKMEETVNRITSTLSSVYSRGSNDENSHRIFYNTTRLLLNNQKKAEDIDTKSMLIVPDVGFTIDEDKLRIVRARYRMWMRQVNFGKTLNEMTESRGNYGGVLVEKVDKDGVLDIEVRQINAAYLDPRDIKNGDKVFMTEMMIHEVMDKYGDSPNITKLTSLYKEGRIKIYEVFTTQDSNCYQKATGGEMMEAGDYSKQYYVVGQCMNGKQDGGEMVTLVSEVYTEDRFKYLPYEKRPAISGNENILGIGIVEQSFTAQRMANFAINAQKDILTLASKVVVEAPIESRLRKQRSIFNIKNGSVIEQGHSILNMMPTSFSGINSFLTQWENNIQRAGGALDVTVGETMPSGTSFALGAMLNQEARGYYDYRIEEMGLFLNEINRDWIMPYIVKDINNSDFLVLNFTPEELKQIDMIARNDYANKRYLEDTKAGKFQDIKDPAVYIETVNQALAGYATEIGTNMAKKGSTRVVGTKDLNLSGIEFRTDIAVDNEQRKTSKYIETLSAIALQKAQVEPGSQPDKILDKALNALGISPETLE